MLLLLYPNPNQRISNEITYIADSLLTYCQVKQHFEGKTEFSSLLYPQHLAHWLAQRKDLTQIHLIFVNYSPTMELSEK